MMYSREELKNILFIDIETVSASEAYDQLPERLRLLWEKKAGYLMKDTPEVMPDQAYTDKSAIFAEFGKVCCISSGVIRFQGDTPVFHVKSFCGSDEAAILEQFREVLNNFTSQPQRAICAHNGKEFDFPFLGRRYLINRQTLPEILRCQGRKPWEVSWIDTLDLWKFNSWKSTISLDLLTAILDIPSPKDDIDGSMVGRIFWEDGDHDRIARYCEKDVLATAQIMLRFAGLNLISPENVNNA